MNYKIGFSKLFDFNHDYFEFCRFWYRPNSRWWNWHLGWRNQQQFFIDWCVLTKFCPIKNLSSGIVAQSKMYCPIKKKLPLIHFFWPVKLLQLVENDAHLKKGPFFWIKMGHYQLIVRYAASVRAARHKIELPYCYQFF